MLQHKPQIFQGQYAFCSNRRNSNTSDLNPFAESIQRENVEDLPQMHRKTSLQYLQAKHISGKKCSNKHNLAMSTKFVFCVQLQNCQFLFSLGQLISWIKEEKVGQNKLTCCSNILLNSEHTFFICSCCSFFSTEKQEKSLISTLHGILASDA